MSIIFISLTLLLLLGSHPVGATNHRYRRDEDGHGSRFHFGKVAIVLSRGRSGSGFLCRVIENLAGLPRNIMAVELLGGTGEKMLRIANPKAFIKHWLLVRRARHPKNYIGFKWKPYADTPAYDEAWRYVAAHNFSVVYSIRNPLDEFISREKHRQAALPSHCVADDAVCISAARTARPRVHVDTSLAFVNEQIAAARALRMKLQEFKVRFIEISYEELSFGSMRSRLAHLQKVADFLLPAHRHRKVRPEDFEIGIEATSSNNQSSKVANYEELRQAFVAAKYEHLLHA